MRLTIFGATGKTGVELVKQALDQGHVVTAFVRDTARLPLQEEGLSFVVGDVFDPTSIAAAVKEQDAVICSLGAGSSLKRTTVRTSGTVNIISEMQKNDIKRFMVITAMGVGESWDTLTFLNKLFFATLLKSSREDHEAQEVAVIGSGLDWTIVRPSALTDTPRTGVYHVGDNIPANTSKIARADVADLIIKELKENKYIGKAVTITN